MDDHQKTSQSSDAVPSQDAFALSECLTIKDLERLYYDKVLKHDFYGDSYGTDWSAGPYEEMATLLAEVIRPRKHVDVGCGKGFLVLAMRDRGIESFGLDFSPALVRQAPAEVQQYLTVATVEDWIDSGAFQQADLITYMEVFEHLPLTVCESILQTLRDNFAGRLFITIPSYGIDARWKLGIVTNQDAHIWQEDMAANIPFRQIVLHNGLPHHGHISLCSYRWWTEFFLCNGWVRPLDLERDAVERFSEPLRKYRWNPYILERLPLETGEIRVASSNELGNGWHEGEGGSDADAGRWTNGRAEVYAVSSKPCQTIEILVSAPSINIIQEYTLALTVERQTKTADYKLGWEPVYSGRPTLIERERKQMLRFEIDPPASWSAPNRTVTWRLVLSSPSFCPRDLGLSTDARTLGVFVYRIAFNADQ